jgi:hypothetical protein
MLSALGSIAPLSDGLLWICGVVLGGDVLGAILVGAFGWLFEGSKTKTSKRSSKTKIAKQ